MNAHQYTAWSRLCAHLSQAICIDKDPSAEALLERAASNQSDAMYMLAKRVIVLEQALRDADEEIESLEKLVRHERDISNRGVDVCERIVMQSPLIIQTEARNRLARESSVHQSPMD